MAKKEMRINGLKINYIDEGLGEAIVLLHGFCGSSAYWEKIISMLSDRYRIIAPDLPGHGESSASVDYAMESSAEHIHTLIAHLNINRFTLLGHSLGGYIALAYVDKYCDDLTRFGLIHSTAYSDHDETRVNRDKAIASIRETGMESFINSLIPKLFASKKMNSSYIEKAIQIGLQTDAASAIATLEAMKNRKDRRNVLDNLSIPVLLVAGKEDVVIPYEKTFTVSGPHVKQCLLEDTGHMSMYETPELLAKHIDEFMNAKV